MSKRQRVDRDRIPGREAIERMRQTLLQHLDRWQPTTPDERAGAVIYAEMLHKAHLGGGSFDLPEDETAQARAAYAALDRFGGQKALMLVDADSVHVGRELFANLYVEELAKFKPHPDEDPSHSSGMPPSFDEDEGVWTPGPEDL